MTTDAVIEALRGPLARWIEREDIDLGSDEAGVVDCAADTWTLHLERLPDAPWGFLALEDEPDDPREHAAAIRKALGLALPAIAAADRELGGGLSAALAASGDELTRAFVALLAAEPVPG